MDKNKFTVIKGQNNKSALSKQKWELYKDAYDRLLIKCSVNKENSNISDTLCMMFFYGTKYITLKNHANRKGIFEEKVLHYDELMEDFNFIELLYQILGHLTLKQIMGIFPIDKEYDGEKYCCKDYFYTIEHLKGINPDDLLCNQFKDISDFTWIYYNRDIFELEVAQIDIASGIRQCQGHKSIAQEWAEKEGIGFMTISTDGTMKDSNGEKIGKIKPNSGFKVVSYSTK